jgi:eukaryotic-like serine/threonine-protein kinase
MDADQQLGTLAAAVALGQAVDWDAAESAASDDSTRRAIRELRVIAGILQLHASDDPFRRVESAADAGTTVTEPNLRSIGRWGPLLLLSPLGKGAYGDVYRAWDPRVHRQVALKLVRATEPEDRKLFDVIEEARLLAKVRHPNVVTLYGAERIEGQVGFWMEFIEGQTLEQVLAGQGPLSAQEAGTIGIAVCRALAAVHRAGIVHRDVKAHNVMREFGGRIVLMDFGTGLDLDSDSTRPGGISGTPLYLAPEILNGDRPDAAGDIYSTGVLLYHLVTNRYPVTGASLESLRQAHRHGSRAFLSDVRPDLPVAFVRVVEQALAPDAGSRFTSAGAFEAALAHAISAAEASVGIESRGSVPRIRRRRVSSAVLFAAVGSVPYCSPSESLPAKTNCTVLKNHSLN